MSRALATGAALTALLAPVSASACPACAGRASGGVLETVALGALLLLPFAAAAIIIKIIQAHSADVGEGDADPSIRDARPARGLSTLWQQESQRRQAE